MLFSNCTIIHESTTSNDYVDKAIESVETSSLENYIIQNNKYFQDKNFSLGSLIKGFFSGEVKLNVLDYFRYALQSEREYLNSVVRTCINILIICIVLTIINYFTEEFSNNTSEIVQFF